MRPLQVLLWLIARIVPPSVRGRWLEEWRAELAHGRWTMVFGALPDAWALGVVLSLSIGIGANVVAFSFINAAVFRPFPGVDKQHELVRLNLGAQRAAPRAWIHCRC
jgi:hypothetical protein